MYDDMEPQQEAEQEDRDQRWLANMRFFYRRLSMLLVGIVLAAIYLAVGIPVFIIPNHMGLGPDQGVVNLLIWTVIYILILIIGLWFVVGRYLKKRSR